MQPREKIDIEHLVTRAYREKAVHRLRNVGTIALGLTGPKAPGAVFSSDDKVDTSSFSARAAAATRELQARLAAAPDVLLDLHDAVLGLPNFYIERGAGLDFVVWDEETAARDGHRIEVDAGKGSTILKVRRRGGRGPGRDDLLPDGTPRRLTALVTSAIVVLAGQYGDRPHVSDVVIERYRPVYTGADKAATGREPVYEIPPHVVVEERASYAVWHAALGMLAERFAAHAEVEVTGPSAPGEPWKAPARILTGECVHEWHPDKAPEVVSKPKRKRPYVPRKTKENSTVATA